MGTICVLMASLAAVVAATPALADPGNGTRFKAPPAPSAAAVARMAAVPARTPQITPRLTPVIFPPDGYYNCAVDNLCVVVWDPNYLYVYGNGSARIGAWRQFNLFNCYEYTLIDWYSLGFYHNNQRPSGPNGIRSYFRNQYHNNLTTITPDNIGHGYMWDPIWYIRNC
ncbi:hypothetical protein Ais01nite_81160 [Asanoa ishikariensis]|nr:hypothetical protein Ais01nite_81160 [Asanoa ishikariensis]